MSARPPKDPTMGLDMPFNEALERYIGVDPKEMAANEIRSKKKKLPGGKKKKRKPPSTTAKYGNVISLKYGKTSHRRRGLA
jgi:hypothetical protein